MSYYAARLHKCLDLRIDTMPNLPLRKGEVRLSIRAGGICGSDIHYYFDGGIGTIRVREPIILGHEAAGQVIETAPGVDNLSIGDFVAVNPSQPCHLCHQCRDEQHQHCTDMHFLGSAMTQPHVNGVFREELVIGAQQCHRFDHCHNFALMALTEPLSVCLHALSQAGSIADKSVLVTGVGPIGALCVALAHQQKAKHITATDLHKHSLDVAGQLGADTLINVSSDHDLPIDPFDIVFECSASEKAIEYAMNTVKPKGKIIQIGVTGITPTPINTLVRKEIQWIGSFRFHHEFSQAVTLIDNQEIDLSPIITHHFSLDAAHEAIKIARDRTCSTKVIIDL